MAPWVTEKYLAILTKLAEKYNQSKGRVRKELVKQGILEITFSAEKDGVSIPPNLDTVSCQCYPQSAVNAHSL